MLPKLEAIQAGRYVPINIAQLPGWSTMCGLQFENLILNNRKIIWAALNINPADITRDNPYIQRKTSKLEGCQIDYLIQTRFNTLFVCEIKFSSKPLTMTVIKKMREKIKKFKVPRNFSAVPVLIHAYEVTDEVAEADYFFKIIDIGEVRKI